MIKMRFETILDDGYFTMNVKQNQSLFRLVREGGVSEVKSFIQNQYLDETWKRETHVKSGDSVLHVAARNGHFPLVKWLVVDQSLDPSISNHDGKRPLHDAAQYGHLDCVQFLVRQGATVDCLKRADWTPLMLACTKTDVDVVRCLISAGANTQLTNKDGWNCFQVVCRGGNCDIVNCLLDCNGSLWNVSSKNGRTALHTAALHGHQSAVVILLARCAYNVDCIDSCGTTPLMDAIRAGYTDVAETLIQHNADIFKEDNVGHSVLHLAAQAGCEVSVIWLIQDRGLASDRKSRTSGISVLHLAAKEGHHQIISLLCSLGANVNSTDNRGRTALHQACGGQFIDCVRVLYQNGAVDVPDCTGRLASTLTKRKEILDIINHSHS